MFGLDLAHARWCVSARSNGATTCVQAALLDAAMWRASARTQCASTCVQAALMDEGTSGRVSARSTGSTTCVQATTDGAVVALQNSTAPYPGGPALTVSAPAWLTFLDHLAAGDLDRGELGVRPGTYGPFAVSLADEKMIEIRCADHTSDPAVRYTPEEWDIFLAGVKEDAEFTLDWLLDTPTAVRH